MNVLCISKRGTGHDRDQGGMDLRDAVEMIAGLPPSRPHSRAPTPMRTFGPGGAAMSETKVRAELAEVLGWHRRVMVVISDEDLRKSARERLEARRGLVPHLLAYVLVNAGLIAIWALVGHGVIFWPGFVLAGWGIGVVMHFWAAYFQRPVTAADVDREMERLRR